MNFFSNLSIKARLYSIFFMIVIFFATSHLMSTWKDNRVKKAVTTLDNAALKTALATEITRNIMSINEDMTNVILQKSIAEKDIYKKGIDETRTQYKANLAKYEGCNLDIEAKKLLDKLKSLLSNGKEFNNKSVELAYAGAYNEAVTIFIEKVLPNGQNAIATCEMLIKWEDNEKSKFVLLKEKELRITVFVTIIIQILILIISFIVVFLTLASILRQLAEVKTIMDAVADGDISKNVSSDLVNRKDEIGSLATGLQKVINNFKSVIDQLNQGVVTLSSSAGGLDNVSKKLILGSNETTKRASTVAAAAEELSTNTSSVATGIDRASTSLNTVAASTEEMSSTISDISENAEKARVITSDAEKESITVTKIVKELGIAAKEITVVTETITSISAQTNLLALNATIEAARAGIAGKGFAVVANEIKLLAEQTASATNEIQSKINAIQNVTVNAITDIDKITHVIKNISDIVTAIATAIEEQATVSKDVAVHISQATSGVQEANERISQTATVTQTVANDIVEVNNTANEMHTVANQMNSNISELGVMANDLKKILLKFKV